MKIKTETKVGIIGITTIAILVWGINFLKGKNLFEKQNTYYAKYDNFKIENDKNAKIWQFETLEKCGKRLESKDFSNIKAVIQSMSDSETLANNRKIAKETAWQHIGQSPKLVVDFLESKLGEINSSIKKRLSRE